MASSFLTRACASADDGVAFAHSALRGPKEDLHLLEIWKRRAHSERSARVGVELVAAAGEERGELRRRLGVDVPMVALALAYSCPSTTLAFILTRHFIQAFVQAMEYSICKG